MNIASIKSQLQRLVTIKHIVILSATPLVFRFAQYLSGLLVVNILSQSDYGTWMYGFSFLESIMLISGLGSAAGIQFFATRYRGTPLALPYTRYGFTVGTLVNILLVGTLFLLLTIIPFPIAQGVSIARRLILFIIPFGLYTYIQGFTNTTQKAEEFPLLKAVLSGGVLILPVLASLIFGVSGLILAEYLLYIGLVALGAVLLGKRFWIDLKECQPLTDDRKGEFVNYSLYRVGSIVATDLFYSLDTLFIGFLTGSVLMVAEYSVATLIPIALTAIPVTILQIVAPYIQESKDDLSRLKKFYLRTVALLAFINLLFGLYLFFLLAPNIPNLFGAEYRGAIPIFRILLITSFVSGCVRIPALQVLSALEKDRELLQNNLFTGGLHLLITVPFVLFWGTTGAAVSTLIAVSVGSLMSIVSLLQLFYGGMDR